MVVAACWPTGGSAPRPPPDLHIAVTAPTSAPVILTLWKSCIEGFEMALAVRHARHWSRRACMLRRVAGTVTPSIF
jgi:hypothetical protein